MANITPGQAKDAARTLGTKLVAANATQSKEIEELISQINTTELSQEDLSEIGAIIALPDDQFAIIAPAFLTELEKSYNDINTQMLLVQAMNVAGKKYEDIEEEYFAICDTIDAQVGNQLTAPKRDFLKQIIGFTYNSIANMDGIAKKVVNIPIEVLSDTATLPAYAHPSDAGMDVFAQEDITIAPGETKLIPLGIKVAIPLGYELQVRPKSGRCLKTKLRVANTPGTIDAGYRDEVGVIIENIDPPIRAIHPRTQILDHGENYESVRQEPITAGDIEFGQSYTIGAGEKFAQLVLSEVPKVAWIPVDSVSQLGEDRGGGFGSTGLK